MKSDNVKKGMQQAPHRSLFNALGFTEEEMQKPMVGIVSSYNEIVPGHMNLDKIVNAVKLGVAEAGGVPVVFPAIAVCDGIAMGHIGMKYSLVTRDLIADSTECMALAHQFDALVMVPNCDKNVPGLLMAAARINVPTVFVSGGPMLAGHVKGQKRSLSSMFEAVGSYAAGKMTEEDVREFEEKVCPTCGSCSGMYTANSMNCLTEALGMGLQGNGTIPAVYSERIKLAKHAGMAVMEMLRKNIRPRDIMTKEAILNALTVDMALGCSTNSMLHLPAIAHEVGFDFDIAFANEISEKTPNLCHLAPAGPTYMEDLNEAGGVYAVARPDRAPARRGIRGPLRSGVPHPLPPRPGRAAQLRRPAPPQSRRCGLLAPALYPGGEHPHHGGTTIAWTKPLLSPFWYSRGPLSMLNYNNLPSWLFLLVQGDKIADIPCKVRQFSLK